MNMSIEELMDWVDKTGVIIRKVWVSLDLGNDTEAEAGLREMVLLLFHSQDRPSEKFAHEIFSDFLNQSVLPRISPPEFQKARHWMIGWLLPAWKPDIDEDPSPLSSMSAFRSINQILLVISREEAMSLTKELIKPHIASSNWQLQSLGAWRKVCSSLKEPSKELKHAICQAIEARLGLQNVQNEILA